MALESIGSGKEFFQRRIRVFVWSDFRVKTGVCYGNGLNRRSRNERKTAVRLERRNVVPRIRVFERMADSQNERVRPFEKEILGGFEFEGLVRSGENDGFRPNARTEEFYGEPLGKTDFST